MHIRFRRGSSRKVLARIKMDRRTFTVTEELQSRDLQLGHIHPRRPHYEISEVNFLGSMVNMSSETSMRFKVFETDHGQRGLVTNVEVVPLKKRRGWATSMVKVLMQLYPECVWTVESPNEQSGQLFVHLAQRFRRSIVPPLVDLSYPVDEQKRYGTRLDHTSWTTP